jgi:hypothetical protein
MAPLFIVLEDLVLKQFKLFFQGAKRRVLIDLDCFTYKQILFILIYFHLSNSIFIFLPFIISPCPGWPAKGLRMSGVLRSGGSLPSQPCAPAAMHRWVPRPAWVGSWALPGPLSPMLGPWSRRMTLTFLSSLIQRNQDENLPHVFCKIADLQAWQQWKVGSIYTTLVGVKKMVLIELLVLAAV